MPPRKYDGNMITTILFVCLIIGTLVILRYQLAAFDETGSSTLKGQPAAATLKSDGTAYQDFCRSECRYRYVCLSKRMARQKETCYEFELSSNAPW